MKTPLRLLLLATLALAARAGDVSAQTVDIAFKPDFSRSVSLTMNVVGDYDFGTVIVGSSTVANSSISVTNDGAVAASLSIVADAAAIDLGLYPDLTPMNQNWTLSSSTSPGVDTFALFAVFQSTKPGNGQYADEAHRVASTVRCASDYPSATPVERYRGGQSGVRVPAGAAAASNVGLWLNLFAPTRSSNLKQKQFNVIVVTGACD